MIFIRLFHNKRSQFHDYSDGLSVAGIKWGFMGLILLDY